MKKNYEKIYKKMDLLEDLKMSLLNSNFVMIYIVHKKLALLKNYLNYLRDNIFECFSRSIIDFYFLFFNIFFTIYNDGKFKS